MIKVQLRKAMDDYREKTGMRLTYAELASRTGLSVETVQAIATRADYNPTLKVIEKICVALDCSLHSLLSWKQ